MYFVAVVVLYHGRGCSAATFRLDLVNDTIRIDFIFFI